MRAQLKRALEPWVVERFLDEHKRLHSRIQAILNDRDPRKFLEEEFKAIPHEIYKYTNAAEAEQSLKRDLGRVFSQREPSPMTWLKDGEAKLCDDILADCQKSLNRTLRRICGRIRLVSEDRNPRVFVFKKNLSQEFIGRLRVVHEDGSRYDCLIYQRRNRKGKINFPVFFPNVYDEKKKRRKCRNWSELGKFFIEGFEENHLPIKTVRIGDILDIDDDDYLVIKKVKFHFLTINKEKKTNWRMLRNPKIIDHIQVKSEEQNGNPVFYCKFKHGEFERANEETGQFFYGTEELLTQLRIRYFLEKARP